MKVMHIASGDLWAGAEKQLCVLLGALRERGDVEVEAIVLNPGELSQRLQAAGIPLLTLDESAAGGLSLHRSILRHLRARRPDLVHTHRVKENVLGGLAAARLGIPSLRTQHGAQEHPVSLTNPRRTVMGVTDYLVGRIAQKKVVAVSEPLARDLRRLFSPAKVALIPNGIDVLDDASATRQPPPTIGIVGRLVPVKRVDLFIEIAQWVAQNCTTIPAPLFRILGDGPLRATLEQQARAAGSAIRLEFAGHVADAERQIASLDLLVICSDHEGLPMVALEAMRAGTIVVTHRIGGLPDLLGGGECGVLLENQSPATFGGAIVSLLTDPIRSARLREAARKRIALEYSAARMAQRYLDTYTEALRG